MKKLLLLLFLCLLSTNSYSAEPKADKIRITDAGLYYTGTEVETALQEIGAVKTSDTAYGLSWDGVTTIAPSKNAVYDKIETISAGTGDITDVGDCATGACFTGTSGNTLTFKGATSGTTALKPTAVAGTTTITLPAETGTVITSASSWTGGDLGGTGLAATVAADSIALTTDTTGNYVKDVADGTGIDGTASGEGTTYTPTLDLTEINSATFGSGTFTTLTFDAGASDPVFTFGSGTVAITGTLTATNLSGTNTGDNTVATSGDSATAFFPSGTLEDALLPSTITRDTEWDTIAEIETATSTNIIVSTEIDTSAEVLAIVTDETGTGALTFATSPTFTTKIISPEVENAGNITIDAVNAIAASTVSVTNSDATYTANLSIEGDLTVTGGDIVLGTSSIFSGGDTTSLNLIDAIDATTETTLETALDIGGEVTSTGMASTVIADSVAVTSWNLTTPTLTTSATVTDAFTLGLGSGKGLIQFDDETTDFVSFSNCNVGIGTTSPSEKLHVSGNIKSGGYIVLTANEGIGGNGDLWLQPAGAGSTEGEIKTTIGGVQTFKNSAAGIQVIFNNGKVGIGTTSPGELLSLGLAGTTKGVLSLSGNTSGKIIVQPAAAAGTYTLTLPTAVGAVGTYLKDAAGDGVLSWAAPAGGGDALVANPLSQFAATTSLQLLGVISDETGTGLAVFNNAPILLIPTIDHIAETTAEHTVVFDNTVTLTGVLGAIDAGGATSTEIVNGANPTVSVAGQVSVDTSATSGSALRFYGDAQYTLPAWQRTGFVLLNPVAIDDYSIGSFPANITIRQIRVLCLGGTNIILGFDEADANGANVTAIDADIIATAGTTATDDGTLTNPTVDANDMLNLRVTSISGTPTAVTVTIYFTYDAVN